MSDKFTEMIEKNFTFRAPREEDGRGWRIIEVDCVPVEEKHEP